MTTPTPSDYTIDPQTLLDAHAKTPQGKWAANKDFPTYLENGEGKELAEFGRSGGYSRTDQEYDADCANAEFCALAHNAMPEILERLKGAEAERDGLKGEVDDLRAMLADSERDARVEIKDLREEIKDLKAELREERNSGRY